MAAFGSGTEADFALQLCGLGNGGLELLQCGSQRQLRSEQPDSNIFLYGESIRSPDSCVVAIGGDRDHVRDAEQRGSNWCAGNTQSLQAAEGTGMSVKAFWTWQCRILSRGETSH